jgi:2-oxoglutarate dehydrogenase E2 component (dihydrolipoamide succinyltransferase)
MAAFELVMPKLGESIIEATIIKWLKAPGDAIEADETVLEIATDKVDSDVPSPVGGVLLEQRFKEGDVVPIGQVIALIQTAGDAPAVASPASSQAVSVGAPAAAAIAAPAQAQLTTAVLAAPVADRFYSPLVMNIARQEGIAMAELAQVPGTGSEGRVTKKDILAYLQQRSAAPLAPTAAAVAPANGTPKASVAQPYVASNQAQVGGLAPKSFSINGPYDIVEMDRMRKMISENMVYSKHVSAHVTSFVEADVTDIVRWRDKNKVAFEAKYGQKLTFTPIFVEAVAKALRDFPMVNIAVDGDKILVRKNINVGMAVALPSGNLIVPVVHNADQLNLAGLAARVNDLSERARKNKLTPDDLSDGTYTLSNVGTFGNVMGTPIILQPQTAVLATGVIKKKPAVLETEDGDVIAVRQLMFLSHSYDHRVIDGALGGSFVRRVADYLENWDKNRSV